MISFPFWKFSPSGNPTLLVPQNALPDTGGAERGAFLAALANTLMDSQHLGAEQVGFVDFEGMPRLGMMGGEFCVNATRAFAALLARRHGAASWEGQVAVSGASGPVPVRVRPGAGGEILASALVDTAGAALVRMPEKGAVLVHLSGISHVVLFGPAPDTESGIMSQARDWLRRLGLDGPQGPEAAGCLWLSEEDGAPRLTPAVWVRGTDSLCVESACGSGTLACALALAERGREPGAIVQPCGHSLTVRLEDDRAWVEGPVMLTAEGTAYIPAPTPRLYLNS